MLPCPYFAVGKWFEPADGEYFDRKGFHTDKVCTQFPVGHYRQSDYGRENDWDGMPDYHPTKSIGLSTPREIAARL
jgi:hypothetical protein